ENRRSLDDVMRDLWANYGKTNHGIEEGEFPQIVERATGVDVGDFARRYLEGTEELDLPLALRHAGLRYQAKPKRPGDDPDGEPGHLGADISDKGPKLEVRLVRDGSPAQRDGLVPGDEVIAINNAQVTPSTFPARMKAWPPGSTVEFTVFRRGWLEKVPVQLGPAVPENYQIVPLEDPTDLGRTIFESWLETKWVPSAPPT
ncbi:MAG: PDZ domain-containing protein, partial [Thermoplasmata archaeon]